MAIAQSLWNKSKSKKMMLVVEPMLQPHRGNGNLAVVANTDNGGLKGEQSHNNDNYSFRGIKIKRDLITLCKQGRLAKSLDMLQVMDDRGIRADSSIYCSLLQECVNRKALPEGKLIHSHMIDSGFHPDIYLQTKLVIMYAKCGSLVVARQLLEEMSKPNVVACSAMIAGYAKDGHDQEALELYYQMQRTSIQPNQFTFSSVLPACANSGALERGKEIHEDIIRSGFQFDTFVSNALIDMYVKCGSIEDARQVFDKMPERDLISWNVMIAGCAQNGHVDDTWELFDKMPERDVVSWTAMIAAYVRHGLDEEALALVYEMQRTGVQLDQFTFAGVLPACANLEALEHGKEVHQVIIKRGFQSNVFLGSALVDVYAKCGSIEDARQVFGKMTQRDVVLWNAMIAGYAQNGYLDEALILFQKMPEQNVISWNAMIAGYAQNGYVDKALNLFQHMPEQNLVSWNAMIAAYAQSGHVDEFLQFFHKMPEQNVVSWNTMIAGCVQNGRFDEALKVFQRMQLTSVKPTSVTFASLLPACANLAVLEHGKKVHEDIIRSGFLSDIFVGNALVDMYAKCGSLEDARKVFDKMPRQSVVSWTAMMVGYAMHGCGKEALQLFEQMQLCGTKPNHVTFVGVLSACCHAGLVDDGCQYFHCMSHDYHIKPTIDHYCCMVGLLGRAGRLEEAQDFINKMPIKPDAAVWGSLLAACRMHTNIELGMHAAEQLFESDPKTAANYVLLSNIYAAAGRWTDVQKVRKLMKERKVKKMPGCSWIEINNKLYTFLLGDTSHPQMRRIYAELERLSGQMKEAGYVADTEFVLHDVEEEQKEHILSHHSEKLAIAFGLIKISPGAPIRVVKNLRVCGDCHSATKFISKIVAREIVVRDANRFHHFKDGQCSCRDYW